MMQTAITSVSRTAGESTKPQPISLGAKLSMNPTNSEISKNRAEKTMGRFEKEPMKLVTATPQNSAKIMGAIIFGPIL